MHSRLRPDSPTSLPTSPPDLSSVHQQLQQKTSSYSALSLPHASRFFLDKLVTLTQKPQHILQQARLYFQTQQYRRALHLLNSHNLPSLDAEARLLAAKCLFELADFEQCLAVLGEDDHAVDTSLSVLTLDGTPPPREVSAAFCLLRADVYQKMDNPGRAVFWYKRALRCDVYCVDAFYGICEANLITMEEAKAFITTLTPDNSSDDSPLFKWLSHYYSSYIDSKLQLQAMSNNVSESIDLRLIKAKRAYQALDFNECLSITKSILAKDPFADSPVILLHLAALVELDERHTLFVTAHQLVDRQPKSAISWLAVGYYYLLIQKPDVARRFLQKSTTLDARLAPAWVAFGHAFGARDESDQAMASYRTANRLFPGAELPVLFMAMEYMRQNSLVHATMLLKEALAACPNDPAPSHELGVAKYRMGDFEAAEGYLQQALKLWNGSEKDGVIRKRGGRRADAEEATLVNLGHCYRRLNKFELARVYYERALALAPRNSSTCVALGMTLHAMWDIEGAVAMYHRALRYAPEDAVCSELLERGLRDMFILNSSHRRRKGGMHQQQPQLQHVNG